MVKTVNLITTEILVTPISLARVLSCIIDRLNRNNPFSDLTSYRRLFFQKNYSGGGLKVYPIKSQREANFTAQFDMLYPKFSVSDRRITQFQFFPFSDNLGFA